MNAKVSRKRLEAMLLAGLSHAEIARRCGYSSANGIHSRVYLLGLSKKIGRIRIPLSDVRAAYETYVPTADIARAAGVTIHAIYRVAKKHGWRKPSHAKGERPCVSCLMPLRPLHGMPRCDACDRARYRYGACSCGRSRRLREATCVRCGHRFDELPPRRGLRHPRTDDIIAALTSDPFVSVSEVAKRFQVGESTCGKIARRHGLSARRRRRMRNKALAEARRARAKTSRPCGCGSRGRHKVTCTGRPA